MKNTKETFPKNILAFKYKQGVPTAEACIERQLANLVFTFGREAVQKSLKRAGLGQMKSTGKTKKVG